MKRMILIAILMLPAVSHANKFRIGFRYKINDNVRIDPHVFMDNKLKDNWAFGFGPALRLDITY